MKLFGQANKRVEQVSTSRALRHLLVFQVKLALDAIRDLALSPVSIVVFIVDVIRKPLLEESLYLRLMQLGQRSDRLINLFDEHSEHGHYTVDETLASVEERMRQEMERRAADKPSLNADKGERR
ncbi:MAG: hypothetical protein ABJ308_18625 [Halieaceae bacterium]